MAFILGNTAVNKLLSKIKEYFNGINCGIKSLHPISPACSRLNKTCEKRAITVAIKRTNVI